MESQRVIKKIYRKICNLLSLKNISWMAIVGFIFLLLPICYLSFVNRATGDDYGYGIFTREAWVTTGSLLKVMEAAGRTVKHYYYTWQGTWFSIFVFSLQPEVFHEHAYVIVVFLMLFLWIGSTFLLFNKVLHKELSMDIWSCCLVTIIFLIISIEFIPNTRASIFWYNGTVHYMLPFTMCQLLIYLLICYGKEYKIRYLTGIIILMVFLGGSNYQAALFALIIAVYAGIINYCKGKNKHIFLLLIPIFLEMIGLIISMKAPGNKVRGGEEFGFSVAKGIKTIGMSFVEGIATVGEYLKEKPLVFVGLFIIFLIVFEVFLRESIRNHKEECFVLRHPFWGFAALCCLYCAMQAPEIYAGVSVSKGVDNTNFLVFLLCTFAIMLIVAGKVVPRIKTTSEEFHCRIVVPGIILCLIAVILFKGEIRSGSTFSSLEYITSGQAADFKEQMELQTKLMMDESTEDVVVPEINGEQGPLSHMPVTDDNDNFTNWATSKFYGKNSVISMTRPEWIEEYGSQWHIQED